MHIGSTAPLSQVAAAMPKPAEATEGAGPDKDSDSDNGGAVKSATTAAVGKNVDVTG